MTRNKERNICIKAATLLFAAAMMVPSAGAAGMADAVKPIVELINSLMAPLLSIVVAVGSLYCILLGVKYAKAEEPQDREKAKQHLKNAIVGFLLIFVFIVALNLLKVPLMEWVDNSVKNGGGSTVFGTN